MYSSWARWRIACSSIGSGGAVGNITLTDFLGTRHLAGAVKEETQVLPPPIGTELTKTS